MDNGDFVSAGETSGTLTLGGATLVGVQGLAGYGIPNSTVTPPLGLGTVTLTTAPMTGGNILTGATFEGGGTFTDAFSDGLVFTGTFNTASFNPKAGTTNTWLFIGDVVGGTLTVPGYIPQMIGEVTVRFTAVTGPPTCTSGGGCTFAAGLGTTNIEYVPPLSPVPEPGSLTLLGCGMAVLVLVRVRRENAPQ